MIQVTSITKNFGQVTAVDDVSFKVEAGEIMGFLGPNGAGKTTTMRILAGFIAPTKGSASVAGFDVARESLKARHAVGYMPEFVPLYTEMRVMEFLNFRARLKGLSRNERRSKLPELMALTGITDVQRKLTGALSKGFRQRLGLTDALIGDPKVLILDEPTIGLDPNQIRGIRDFIKSLGGVRTILLSSHILPEVELVADRVVVINRGRIAAIDAPAELAERLGLNRNVRLELKGDLAMAARILAEIDDVKNVERTASGAGDTGTFSVIHAASGRITESIFKKMVEHGITILEMRKEETSLEEIFTRLTTKEALN